MIDLQNHTTASDGELSPEELVDIAIEKNLKAIAITDHDSVSSLKPAIEYAEGKNVEVIPGIELSCDDSLFNYDKIDMLGLFIDFENKGILRLIESINNIRESNKKQIIDKLKSLGYDIEYEDVKKTVNGTFGRPHIAKYLLKKYPNEFTSVRDIFDKLIGRGKLAFVETTGLVSIRDGIKKIKESGGISILAHPGIYKKEDSVMLIDYFIENGGDGIETYYPYHVICPELNLDEKGNNEIIKFYKNIVKSKGILESGGNDHHGGYRPTIGKVKIPDEVLEKLKEKILLHKNFLNRMKQTSWTIWFTGLHGAGKTTIVDSLAEKLRSKNIPVVVLDGDKVRETVSADLGYSLEERNEHMKRVAGICKIVSSNGILAIASVASPTEQSRQYARKIVGMFFLVFVKCPLEICRERDIKGHYKKAMSKEKGFEHFMQVSSEFEEPGNPDLILETNKESVEESVNKLLNSLKERAIIQF